MAYLHFGAFVLRMHDHLWFWDAVCRQDVRVRGGRGTVLFLPRGFRGFGTKHGIRTDEVFQLLPSGLMTTKISDQKK
jgi:PII-like signaling protein